MRFYLLDQLVKRVRRSTHTWIPVASVGEQLIVHIKMANGRSSRRQAICIPVTVILMDLHNKQREMLNVY